MRCRHRGARHGNRFSAGSGVRRGDGAAGCGEVGFEAARVGHRSAATGIVQSVGQLWTHRGGAGFEGNEHALGESAAKDCAVGPGDHHARNRDIAGISGPAHGDGKAIHIIDHHHGDRTRLLGCPNLAGKEAGTAVDESNLASDFGSIGNTAVVPILAGIEGLGGDNLCRNFPGRGDGKSKYPFDSRVLSHDGRGCGDADGGGRRTVIIGVGHRDSFTGGPRRTDAIVGIAIIAGRNHDHGAKIDQLVDGVGLPRLCFGGEGGSEGKVEHIDPVGGVAVAVRIGRCIQRQGNEGGVASGSEHLVGNEGCLGGHTGTHLEVIGVDVGPVGASERFVFDQHS